MVCSLSNRIGGLKPGVQKLIADPFDKPAAAGKLRTGFADYTDLGIRVYKCMRIYLCGESFATRARRHEEGPAAEDTQRRRNSKSEARNPKWFDKLTILSRVEGQIQNANVRMTKTGAGAGEDLVPSTALRAGLRIGISFSVLPRKGPRRRMPKAQVWRRKGFLRKTAG
jgi:hypothetical protein